MNLWLDTLRKMVVVRRLLPIAGVAIPLVGLEALVGGLRGAVYAYLMFAGLLVVGPASYRALLLRPPYEWVVPARVASFTGVILGYVYVTGLGLPRLLDMQRTLLGDVVSLYAAVPLFWAASWAIARDIALEDALEEARQRYERLEREAERAQLLAIRNHLDPHFLFNTLGAIAEWCREDPLVAERALLQLSDMLRGLLDAMKSTTWPLSRELDLAQQLLELHHTRDAQRFVFELDAGPECAAISVPPLLVLPLVENAIKHGPAAGHDGKVVVRCRVDGERMSLQVRNPGSYAGPREGSNGLPTMRRRLLLAYDGCADLHIDASEGITTAELTLPLTGAVEPA